MNPGLPVMSVGLPAALFFFITNLQGRYNCLPVPVWSVSSSLQTTRCKILQSTFPLIPVTFPQSVCCQKFHFPLYSKFST